MSVLIRGMEMPMNCDECNMYVGTAYTPGCLIESNGIPNRYNYDPKKRPNWCPLVELPPKHGRLIDADALMDIFADRLAKVSVRYGIDSAVAGAVSGAMKLLDVQPTVIDAEGEG